MPSRSSGVDDPNGLSRRRFLEVMGASLALAGSSGCLWREEKLAPPAHPVPGRVGGERQDYATAMELAGVAQRLLVTCCDGRPIKVEGNPLRDGDGARAGGGTDAAAQAAIMELYDPCRSRGVLHMAATGQLVPKNWEDFFAHALPLFEKLRASRGAGLRVLSEASSSPSLLAQKQRLLSRYPEARWYEYEPLSDDNQREGARLAFGRPCRTHLRLDRALVTACFDADVLHEHPAAVDYTYAFTRRRRPESGAMNRLYSVEGIWSLTGAFADHRLALRSDRVLPFLSLVAREVEGGLAKPGVRPPQLVPEGSFLTQPRVAQFRRALVADLLRNRGRSAVIVGPRQPPAAHHLAHWLNERLGNAGQTVWYTAGPDSERPGHVEAIRALVRELNAGAVNTLLILGGNPVFNAPADLNFAEALHRVENTMHLGLHVNETSRAADWRLPRAHFLESWGDARAYDGTLCLVQPLIEPLHGGKPALELLARLTDDDYYRGYDLVRRALRQFVGDGDFEKQWRQALHDGFLRGSRWAIEKPAPKAPDAASLDAIQISRGEAGSDELEVVFCRDSKLHDGRFSNNGWLQELPDPLTRLTWGNAALMSPATARSLGVRGEQLIGILRGERAVELPVLVLPGMAAGTVAVALGYGGVVGTGSGEKDGTDAAGVGSNAYPLRTSDAMGFVPGVRITAAGRSCTLALAELRDSLDAAGRATRAKLAASLARRITLQQYRDGAGAGRGTPAATRPAWLWEERQYPGHRWGMAIDLSLCTGCGACVVACQAENNIPIVGSQEVRLGREMHWLRVDRYFAGSGDSVSVLYQPVACQHCELAPCEQVCPVGATVHDAEGLNGMVYNRCIGCRYCSNNCPYKVRRFNFFDNFREIGRDRRQQVRKLGLNPEVTIRSRGVMEKCTYCVQRIQWAKIRAKNEGRTVREGEIVPACAQACPAGAIIFGDLNDPGSAVAGLRAGARSYALLADLNVRPRTTYLERVTNPNSRLGQADEPVSGAEGG